MAKFMMSSCMIKIMKVIPVKEITVKITIVGTLNEEPCQKQKPLLMLEKH